MASEDIGTRLINSLSIICRLDTDISSINQAVDGIVIVQDVIPLDAILGSEHSVLYELVSTCVTHQVAPISRHLVDIQVLPLLSGEVLLTDSRHPLAESLEVSRVRCLGVWVTALKRLAPSLVKAFYRSKECKGVTVVQDLPTLHLRVVEVWNTLESEHALGGLIVVEVVLTDEYNIVIRRRAVEKEDWETVNGGSDIIRVVSFYGFLLSLSTKFILSVNLSIEQRIIPKPCDTRIVRSRRLRIVGFQTPTIHWLCARLESIEFILYDIAVSIVKHRISHLLGVDSKVLLRITH